jgi:hypothetical protein
MRYKVSVPHCRDIYDPLLCRTLLELELRLYAETWISDAGSAYRDLVDLPAFRHLPHRAKIRDPKTYKWVTTAVT